MHEGAASRFSRKKKIGLLVMLPIVLALHVWLIALGGGWRVFAITEAAVGVFLALAVRDITKLNGE